MSEFSTNNPIRNVAQQQQQQQQGVRVPTGRGANNVTLRKRQKKYEKPSIDKAIRYKLQLHPSYVPDGMSSHDRRLFRCCTTTGRFCGKKTSCIDCCCEGRVSSLTAFGSGVTSYFKNEKWLTMMFIIMTVCFLPSVIINTYGPASDQSSIGALRMSSTTLANLASVNGTGFIYLPRGAKVEKQLAGLIYSLCDLAACIVLVLGWIWLRYFEDVEQRQVDRDTLTADDYTVYLPWVPSNTTEADLRELVQRNSERNQLQADATEFAIAEVHLVEDQMDVVSTYVSRGRIFRQIERLNEKIARLEDLVARGFVGCTICCGGVPGEVRRMKKFSDVLALRATKLSEKATVKSSGGVVAAFITFQQKNAARWLVSEYPKTFASYLFQAKRWRLLGHRIRALHAPTPSSVIWANLNITLPSQIIRQFFTSTLTAVLLVGSFLLLWFASYKQQEFAQLGPANTCKESWMIDDIAANRINGTTVLQVEDPMDPLAYCWCATQTWTGMTSRMILESKYSEKCPAMSCPQLFDVDPFGVGEQPFCVQWVRDRGVTIALTIAASFSVIFINSFLALIMRVLTSIEGHHSFDDLNASLALRLFFAQFFNTGVLMVIINASANDIFPVKFKTGKYDDFTVGWYENVGASLMTTMIINIFTPHMYSLVMATWYCRSVRNPKIADTAPSQRDLNEAFIGPYMDYATRYASLYNTLFVTFVFSTGMPVMTPIAGVSFLLSYWIDKTLFMWYFRKPPSFGVSLQKTMSALVPVAIVCHLAVGTWMISYISIFDDMLDPLGVSRYVTLANHLFESYAQQNSVRTGAGRVTQMQSLPLLVLLAVMVFAFVLRFIFISMKRVFKAAFNFFTCGYCVHVKFEWETDELVYDPTYTEAIENEKTGGKHAMHGLQSYNMLMNPEIQAAFAITPDFARKHKALADVALYRVASMAQLRSQLGQSSKSLPTTTGSSGAAVAAATSTSSVGSDKTSPHPPSGLSPRQLLEQQQEMQQARDLQLQQEMMQRQQQRDQQEHDQMQRAIAASILQQSNVDRAVANVSGAVRVDYDNPGDIEALNTPSYSMGDDYEEGEEEEGENDVDDEVGGYLAGLPPAITASSRRLRVAAPDVAHNTPMSMFNLLQSGYIPHNYQQQHFPHHVQRQQQLEQQQQQMQMMQMQQQQQMPGQGHGSFIVNAPASMQYGSGNTNQAQYDFMQQQQQQQYPPPSTAMTIGIDAHGNTVVIPQQQPPPPIVIDARYAGMPPMSPHSPTRRNPSNGGGYGVVVPPVMPSVMMMSPSRNSSGSGTPQGETYVTTDDQGNQVVVMSHVSEV